MVYHTLNQLEGAAPKQEATLTVMDRYVASQPASELLDPDQEYVPPKKAASGLDQNQHPGRGLSHAQHRRPQQQQQAAHGLSRPQFQNPIKYNPNRNAAQQVPVTKGNAEPVATGVILTVPADFRKLNCFSCYFSK